MAYNISIWVIFIPLNFIYMKLFSFKKPVVFEGERLIVNDLALNHSYKKQGAYMVVEGYDKSTKTIYKAVYDSIGQFLFVKLKRTSHSVSLLSWKQEYDTEFIQKLDENGKYIVIGKGTPAHKAAVTGDTVGDTRKDVVGVALDIFIKLMSTMSNTLASLFYMYRIF